MSEQKHTPEPFGYFKAEPFGWTDCAETDDCAIPLYDEEAISAISKQRDSFKDAAEYNKRRAEYAEKQRDELLAAAVRQFKADYAFINMPLSCTKQEHEDALEEHTNAHYGLAKVIASVKYPAS